MSIFNTHTTNDKAALQSVQFGKHNIFNRFYVVTILLMLVNVMGASALAFAQESTDIERKVPTLRNAVYEQLQRAQRLADADDIQGALEVLDVVQSKISSMNGPEKGRMYSFYGFVYYAQDNLDKTLEYFKLAVEQSPIPVSFEKTTLYSLAQLSMAKGDYEQVIKYLERWESLNKGIVPPRNYILKAQALYQNKAYEQAIVYIEDAIKNHEDSGYLPPENWLVLQRAIYFEMQQSVKVKDIIIKLIRLYDQPKYWVQLAGMYGQLEQEEKQLAAMEIAYQRGFVTSASDTFNLAQLYYYHGVPFKGAMLMEQALNTGVLQSNLRNLTFLAQSWQSAKEDKKAVPVMQQAAQLSQDGELDAQLALLYYNLEDYEKAISAAQLALQKGSLARAGDTHMVLGLSLFNMQQFAQALDQLALAEEFTSSRAAARQWRKYVETERTTAQARAQINAAP